MLSNRLSCCADAEGDLKSHALTSRQRCAAVPTSTCVFCSASASPSLPAPVPLPLPLQIDIKPENVNILDGMSDDLQAECDRYEAKIAALGGIELFLGGIGPDGHIAFSE